MTSRLVLYVFYFSAFLTICSYTYLTWWIRKNNRSEWERIGSPGLFRKKKDSFGQRVLKYVFLREHRRLGGAFARISGDAILITMIINFLCAGYFVYGNVVETFFHSTSDVRCCLTSGSAPH